jgi:tetratricopeptide (TPR) repeat protein
MHRHRINLTRSRDVIAGAKAVKHAVRFSVADALNQALAHHQQGRFREADQLYSEVLEQQPNHPDALHLSGVLAMQTGNPRLAIERILRAIAFARNADFYSHLGEAYRGLGEHEHAIRACRAALTIEPRHMGALAAAIAHRVQPPHIVLQGLVIYVGRIVLDNGNDGVGCGEPGEVVNVAVSIIAGNAFAQLPDLLDAEVNLQVLLDLLPIQQGIAIRNGIFIRAPTVAEP